MMWRLESKWYDDNDADCCALLIQTTCHITHHSNNLLRICYLLFVFLSELFRNVCDGCTWMYIAVKSETLDGFAHQTVSIFISIHG